MLRKAVACLVPLHEGNFIKVGGTPMMRDVHASLRTQLLVSRGSKSVFRSQAE